MHALHLLHLNYSMSLNKLLKSSDHLAKRSMGKDDSPIPTCDWPAPNCRAACRAGAVAASYSMSPTEYPYCVQNPAADRHQCEPNVNSSPT